MTEPRRDETPVWRRRLLLVLVGIGVIALGLAARFGVPGIVGDVAGGVFYASLVYVVLAFFAPRARPSFVALLAAIACFAVEFLQLTDIPRTLGQAFPPVRLVLGSTFVWSDLPAYAAGALVAFLTDSAFRRRGVRRTRFSHRSATDAPEPGPE